jgi:hypothetical protein
MSSQGGVKDMRENTRGTMNMNDVLIGIKHLKEEVEKSAWLLDKELTRKIIEVIEEKENDVLENLMWFA